MANPVLQSLPRKFAYTPSRVLLALLWLAAALGGLLSLLLDTSWVKLVAGLSSLAFIILLIWACARQKPFAADLPDLDFLLTPRLRFGAALACLLAGAGLLFVIGMAAGPAFSLLSASALIGAGITAAWRSRLTSRDAILGGLAGLIAGGGIAFLGNGDLSWAIFNLIVIPPIFTGGALLVRRTHLGRFRLLEGEYSLSLQGFLWGCVLAVPASILNLLGNVQASDTWVRHGWQPLYAIVPGIAEETWARLFLTSFVYALLRPTTNERPRRAVLAAVLVGALTHGFLHTGIDPLGLVLGSLLYLIPAALLFIKYDFEHAAGYHFFIDLVRFGAALF